MSCLLVVSLFFASRRRHTRCALVTGVQTCALPIFEAERVPVATGRTPNTKGLGLAEAGVAQTRNGGIEVDERMRTTRPGTYAAGDVTGLDQFVYMAAHGAKIAARNALNGDALAYDNRSEEHTSELQSLMRISYAVFCLKKTTHIHKNQLHTTTPNCK